MKKRILTATLLALAAAGSAQAALLSELFNGGSITAGDKRFDNWTQSFYDASDGRSFNAANIEVTALNDGGLNPGPGLSFSVKNGELSVVGNDLYAYIDLMFGFRATVLDPALKITDASLAYVPGGAVKAWRLDRSYDVGSYIQESIGTGAGMGDLGSTNVQFSELYDPDNLTDPVDPVVSTNKISDSASFAPQSSVWVTKNILVWAGDATDGANVFGFEQRFSQTAVPEPASLALAVLALGGLAFSRRKGKAAASV